MYGELTAHAVGVILKEMVRRAIEAIQAHQFSFEAFEKTNPHQAGRDFVTTADHAAQDIYLRMIRECFPGIGVIAEEDELREPCRRDDDDLCVTVDPLDGTRAFIRRQSTGIGTMIAMLRGDQVISAYVGDAMTREIYGYRPESDKAHRISQYNVGRQLQVDTTRPLSRQPLLMHDEPHRFTDHARRLFVPPDARAFASFEIASGSIGIQFSRLWKGEVGGILLLPGELTPWDGNPVLGISRQLGFRFVTLRDASLIPTDIPAIRDYYPLPHEILVVHESRMAELRTFHETLDL